MMTIDTRVRSLIRLETDQNICGDTDCKDLPTGSPGTITSVNRYNRYGVLFDNDTHQLPCSMSATEIEAI